MMKSITGNKKSTVVRRCSHVFSQRHGAGETWGDRHGLRVTVYRSGAVAFKTARPEGAKAASGTLSLTRSDFHEVAKSIALWQLNPPRLAWVNVAPPTKAWYTAPLVPGPRTLFLESGQTGRPDKPEQLYECRGERTTRSIPGLDFDLELRFGTGDAFALVAQLPKHRLVLARSHFALFETAALTKADLGRLSFLGRDEAAGPYSHGIVCPADEAMTVLAAAGLQVGALPQATPEQRREWLGESS